MKRISITIKKSRDSKPDYPLADYLFDTSEFCDYSPSETIESDSSVTMVWYNASETPYAVMLRDSNSTEEYELTSKDISDAEWSEIKSAMDEGNDDAAFFERLRQSEINKSLDAPRISNRIEALVTEEIDEISDGASNEEPVRKTQAGDDLFISGCL